MRKIKKAVIPVAGLGTRFLPVTKVVPKELLPIVDKPSLQYVVEEAVSSGIEEVVFVVNPAKAAIEEHFRTGTSYDNILRKLGKQDLLKDLGRTIRKLKVTSVEQTEAKGLGHAVLCAKDAVGDEPFVLILPDMIIDSERPCTLRMIETYKKSGKGVIATLHAARHLIPQYGIIAVDKKTVDDGVYRITGLVEKPRIEDAPSDLYIVGRYLLPPSVFGYIENTRPGKGGEIQITDALARLARDEGLLAMEFEGILHDTGDKLEYLKAIFYYAMKNENYRGPLIEYLEHLRHKSFELTSPH